ncbi:MAG: helix-turn-helix transcriptional regulator [Spirochaetales bacterium]|nr:helix-turn-helix transcriptional regulator [Spirochaetales bacterium]
MEHFVSFLTVIAISLSSVSSALTLWLYKMYHNKASLWFAASIAGLGCFLIEILIWRYAAMIQPIISDHLYKGMLSFSNIWALAGGVLVCSSMPRFAMIQTGASPCLKWILLKWIPPILAFISGFMFLMNILYGIALITLQSLLFSTLTLSIIIVIFYSHGKIRQKSRNYFKSIIILSVICLPFIILDATGHPLPFLPADIIISLYAIGICITSLNEAKKLFGQPTYLQSNKISSYFFENYGISKRERDVVELVLEGDSNQQIGEKLFISEKTVENHLTSIFRKTNIKNRIELFRLIHSSRD